MDGYEADTDDTLHRRSRRKSVKELAGMFQVLSPETRFLFLPYVRQ
jgi:hypothetical protein